MTEEQVQIRILRRQISAYKLMVESGDKIRAHQAKLLAESKTVDSEREMNDILTKELEAKDKEIKRRNKIMEDWLKREVRTNMPGCSDVEQDLAWQNFKSIHKL